MRNAHAPLPDSYEGLLSRAEQAKSLGDSSAAIELYRRLLDKLDRLGAPVFVRRPGLRDIQLQASMELSSLLSQLGRYAEAIEIESSLLKTHPEQAALWKRDLAVLRIAHGEVETGLGELQALALEAPQDVWAWIVLGNENRTQGRYADSQAALEQALAIADAGPEKDGQVLAQVQYSRFRLLGDIGRTEEAIAAWEAALAAEPQVKHTLAEVTNLLVGAGRYAEALRYAKRDDNRLQAGFTRGLVAQLSGERDKALQEWRAVAELDPLEFEYGHDQWLESLLRLGDPKPALQRLPQLLSKHGSLRMLTLTGIAWAMYGDRDRAKGTFERCLELLKRSRPPKQKLDSADWRLLDAQVADNDIKASLKPYFAVVETIWG